MQRLLTFCLVAIGFVFALGCASAPRSDSGMCILSTPGHVQDWERLRLALEAHQIRFTGPQADLGTFEISIPSENAARARKLVERMVHDERLTLRITKDASPLIYQVYEDGQKIREESYTTK